MRIDIKPTIDKYGAVADARMHAQFLQSWAWGEFQDGAIRLVIDTTKRAVALSLYSRPLPISRYWYGPRIDLEGIPPEEQREVIAEIISLAVKDGCLFVRLDPASPFPLPHTARPTIDVQPSKTIILDIGDDENTLLAAMHPKTRYNIQLASKKGVTVREAGADDFKAFQRLLNETTERDGFRSHGIGYYRSMLAVPFVKLLVAEYEGKVIAGNIVSFYGDTATYIHGASGNEYRNVMAPYALQWKTIRTAKTKGLRYYDLHGIDEINWPGVTRFKRGFGGNEVVYPGAVDIVISPIKYRIYQWLRRVRRLVGKIGV